MRKHIGLIAEYYRGAIPGVILIMVIMTFAVYTFVNVMGLNEYIGYTKQIYRDSGLENALYFIPSKNEDYYMMPSGEQRSLDMLIRKEILSKPGVDDFCINRAVTGMYGDKYINIIFYDDTMLQRFKVKLRDGFWLDNYGDEKGSQKCIIGGELFNGIHTGSEITMSIGGTDILFNIGGRMGYPAYVPQLLGGDSADDLFRPLDNVILTRYSETIIEKFKSAEINIIEYENYFIVLSENITPEQYSAVTELLTKYGRFYNYSEIIQNTDETNAYKIKTKMPFPLYAFIISTISLLCISILMTTKKLKEYSVYYLVGCSKLRSVIYITAALSIIVVFPCGMNIINILTDPYMFRGSASAVNKSNCYINTQMIIPILIYMIASISVTVTAAVSIYMKYSPFEIRRRTE